MSYVITQLSEIRKFDIWVGLLIVLVSAVFGYITSEYGE